MVVGSDEVCCCRCNGFLEQGSWWHLGVDASQMNGSHRIHLRVSSVHPLVPCMYPNLSLSNQPRGLVHREVAARYVRPGNGVVTLNVR
jgi:hypothetical protein